MEELKGDLEELKREYKEGLRRGNKGLEGLIEGLLDLVYGEDCMMGRQIRALERKMLREKTLPRSLMIKKVWRDGKAADERFWKKVRDKHGLIRDDKGKMIRVDKGLEGKDKGE